MSDELRALLARAAEAPSSPLDVRDVERRSRRLGTTRLTAAAVAVAVVVTAVVAVGWIGDRDGGTAIDPAPRPRPHEVDTSEREGRLPRGPRYEIASGVFGDDWDRDLAGKEWRLLAWGGDGKSCWQLTIGDSPRNENAGCSENLDPATIEETVFGGSMSFLTGSDDPGEYVFVAGIVGPRVDRLVFRDADYELPITLHPAPPETDVPYLHYAVTLPLHDFAELVALSEDGDTLDSHDLCGPGCREERERAEEAKVAEFESAPVTEQSAAATFAVTAAAKAGLVNPLDMLWSYRALETDDGYVARFRAADCSGENANGVYRCGAAAPAFVRVAVRRGRLVVEDADGPMTRSQREALLLYSEPLRTGVSRWRHLWSSFERTGRRRWDVAFVSVWTGNLPGPRDYGSVCRLVVYGRDRRTLHRGRGLMFMVRGEEGFHRVNAVTTTIQTRGRPRGVLVECDDPGPGLVERAR